MSIDDLVALILWIAVSGFFACWVVLLFHYTKEN